MTLQNRRHMLPVLFLLAIFSADYLAHMRRSEADENQPYGLYTSKQILDRTEPLCRLVAPGAKITDLKVTKTEDKHRRLWVVDCTDQSGNYIAGFTWNAETGELFRVGHS